MGNSNEKPNRNSNVKSKNGINIPPALLLTAKRPRLFTSVDDFLDTWTSWKEEFLMFKAMVNEGSGNKSRWADLMLNLMGPTGQTICDTFVFSSPVEREDIDILIKKFDNYFIFSTKKWKPGENVSKYMRALQDMTRKKGVENEEDIKKKILTEIDVGKFTNAAKCFLPTFTFSNDFGKLTLMEIAFFWEMYNDHCLMKTCENNCTFCGGAHINKPCPAYGETCTKCQKQNHFSWKCQTKVILSCWYCGLSHPAAKACCSARNNVCPLCHKIGHVPSKCDAKSLQQRRLKCYYRRN